MRSVEKTSRPPGSGAESCRSSWGWLPRLLSKGWWAGLGVILAFVGLLLNSGGSSSNSNQQRGSPTVGSSSMPTDHTTSAPPTGQPTPVPSQIFSGDVLLSDSLDLDQNPPSSSLGGHEDIFWPTTSEPEIAIEPDSGASHWTMQRVPTEAECADLLTRENLGGNYAFHNVAKGLEFCVKTDQKNNAFVRVTNVSSDGFQLYVIVWENPVQ